MSLFLDEKTKAGKFNKLNAEWFERFKDVITIESGEFVGHTALNFFRAGWNECEKHVRESVSDAADLRSCMCSRFIVEIEQLKAENERLKLAIAGKTGSCVLCEDAQKEIERLKLHDIPGYQEGIEELKAQIEERDEALIDLFELLSHAFAFQTNGDDWEKQGIAIEKHQSLINKIKESGK